jgi:hypothetical protein
MADQNNVVQLRGSQPLWSELLSVTIEQLDELGYRLQQLSPQSSWPPQRWMTDSTPFRMRVTRARKRLGEVAGISPDAEQSSIRWAVEFNDVRLEAERQLRDIDACLCRLQRPDASASERARETEVFTSSRSEFLRALQEIRELLEERIDSC